MANQGFVKPGETSVTQKKEIAAVAAATKSTVGTPKEILAREGITFSFDGKTQSFKFAGDVWDVLPDNIKQTIKTPGQLVYTLGYDITSSAPEIKGNQTLGETPVVNEGLTEEKAKELGVTDINLRNKFLSAIGMGSKEEDLGITDIEKRKEFNRMMGLEENTGLDKNNPLKDNCAQ